MDANGVRELLGGVFKNGGGNPGGIPEVGLLNDGAVVDVGPAGSIPAALKRSSKDVGSGVEVGGTEGGG